MFMLLGTLQGHVPSAIVYNDRQIDDIKAFCFNQEKGSVLSFDKTFNLGHAFVTPAVYKNLARLCKRTNAPPVFIGPIFIHNNSSFVNKFGFGARCNYTEKCQSNKKR